MYKEIIFYHIRNSYDADYVFIKAIEFFGILCGKDEKCLIPFNHATCKIKRIEACMSSLFVYIL